MISVVSQFVSTDEDKLIGDHTKPYCLPIERGANPLDLKCISPQTVSHCYHGDIICHYVLKVADVVSGEYDQAINSFTIIDCRYPYEYEGGHIKVYSNILVCLLSTYLPSGGN